MNGSMKRGRLTAVILVVAIIAIIAAMHQWRKAEELRVVVNQLRAEREAAAKGQPALTPDLQQELKEAQEEIERLKAVADEVHRLRGQYAEWQRRLTEADQLRETNQRLRETAQQAVAQARPAVPPAAWIGVTLRSDPGGGVFVESVVPGSPAANSGLLPGDRVIGVDGQAINSPTELREAIGAKTVGQAIAVDAQRDGATVRFPITTGPFPR
jgi:predicted metalloprotease with PDZ domain